MRLRPAGGSLMSTSLLVVQILNGLQLGVLLFLIAAGLTLVFGGMDFINLAHGVQYMLGAYLAVAIYALTDGFLAALVLALAAMLAFGLLLAFAVFRHLYDRDHLACCDGHLRHDRFLEAGVEARGGGGAAQPADAGAFFRLGQARRRPALSGVAARGDCLGARRRRAAVLARGPYPDRHAGARR